MLWQLPDPGDCVRLDPDPVDESRLGRRDVLPLVDPRPPGLDVGEDLGDLGHVLAEVGLDVGGLVVGLLEGKMVVDLEMEVEVDVSRVLVHRDVVDAQLIAEGHGPDAPGHALALDLARVRVDDGVRSGRDLLDPLLDRFGDGVGPLEGQVAVDVDGHVHEHARPGPADADLADAQHPVDRGGRVAKLLGQALGRPVEENVDRLLAELVADEEDDEGHPDGGHGVGLGQPMGMVGEGVLAQPDQGQSDDDDGRAPDVGREMESVRLEGLAAVLAGHAIEHPRAADVDADGDGHDQKSPQVGIHLDALEEEALDRLVNDPGAGDEEENRLDQGAEVLDLAVPVRVIVVGRLARDAHGQVRDQGGDEIEKRVGRLGQDPQAHGQEADDELQQGQDDGGEDRVAGGRLLLSLGALGGAVERTVGHPSFVLASF